MTTSSNLDITKVFKFYRSSLFSISNDLNFWKLALDNMVKGYHGDSNFRHQFVFESLFAVYDLPYDKPDGHLKIYKESFKVGPEGLDHYRKTFFDWVMNVSILKAYNSCELLLLRSIQLAFFPSFDDPLKNRKSTEKINSQIRDSLSKPDTSNNKHIIEFLKANCPNFLIFADQLIRTDFKTTWQDFFELISILRNVIAHNSSIISIDTLNQIKSKNKDIFELYFQLEEDGSGFKTLILKDGDYFLNFINQINDFALNTTKFVFNKKDLAFLDMS